jgi:hypothetical protein
MTTRVVSPLFCGEISKERGCVRASWSDVKGKKLEKKPTKGKSKRGALRHARGGLPSSDVHGGERSRQNNTRTSHLA